MVFRISAVFLLLLGVCAGVAVILSTGANSLTKEILGLAFPSFTGLILAIAWWRKSLRPW